MNREYLDKLTLKELQEECIRYKLVSKDRKSPCIDVIMSHFECHSEHSLIELGISSNSLTSNNPSLLTARANVPTNNTSSRTGERCSPSQRRSQIDQLTESIRLVMVIYTTPAAATAHQSTSKWSILSKAVQSKTYINSLAFIGVPKSVQSLYFRINKSGIKIPKYENTYRLEPCKPFKSEIVDMILIDVMQDYLIGLKYQSQVCMQICQKMSEEVREKICREFYDR
ncbi:hypothetical protein G5I_07111 [Acromyrmex echinatior]|uniref:Uncharacterized protein n=1 Tax=Acromyrmex echinatior TaxID=103372 RepID=F4WMX3_ACREC|nr:hypothetical protein G5I_07111 [Acromyrmex echinatior]